MICKEYDEKIRQWIEENKDRMVDMWLELIRIPSVRSEPAPGAPFGIPCAEALKKATQFGAEMGFATRLETERGYSLISYGEGEKTIGLFGHSDVVPAGDGWLYTEPFSPVIRDGVVIGRGCGDNKAGVVGALLVAQIVKECNLPVKSRLQVFVGSNEESGMADMEAFVKHEKMPDLCLVPDAAYPCSLGEKGHLKQWNRCKTPLTDILDFHGDGVFNIVLERAVATLRYTPQLLAQLEQLVAGNGAFTLERTAEGHIQLSAMGAAKHSAYPEGSVNAMLLICGVLAQCDALCRSDRRQMQTLRDFMVDNYGTGMGIAFEEPGFGKLTCTNGMVKVEEGLLNVSVDIRYGSGMDGQKLEQMLNTAWENAGWELTYRENHHGAKVDPASPIPALLTQLCNEITGRKYEPYWMPGGTYSRHLHNTFTIGRSIGDPNSKAVMPALPAGHGGGHQRDEVCKVDDFLLGVRLLTHIVLACDQSLHE